VNLGGLRLLTVGSVCAIVLAAGASVAASAPSPSPLRASGTATGDLTTGSNLDVRLRLTHSGGWQNIKQVDVALMVRQRFLDQLVFHVPDLSLAMTDSPSPSVSLGHPGMLIGSYLEVSSAAVRLRAGGDGLAMIIPFRVLHQPPPGARMFMSIDANGTPATGQLPLTPPVKERDTGFSWGILGLAIGAALLVGAFAGNLFSSRRNSRRPPSIYATVQRRLEEDRSKR